ncbi:hypothetical protein [Rathayibacter rathayi]|nr:hypothetical protein [Rathayibacter rathayi]
MGQRDALRKALASGNLAIAIAANTNEKAGGSVCWLFDEAARA